MLGEAGEKGEITEIGRAEEAKLANALISLFQLHLFIVQSYLLQHYFPLIKIHFKS